MTTVLKAIIVLLLIGIVVSLFSGLAFLFKDTGTGSSKRTLYALGVRITLAVLLVLVVAYGLYTGELTMQAPWTGGAA
ncbi:MAG: twin transmembrane helix small protein [Pseudomonadota bacterium]